jgi:hypothetical protein
MKLILTVVFIFVIGYSNAAEFTKENLDLMLNCKGDGTFHDYKTNQLSSVVANDNLHITTIDQRSNSLIYKDSQFICLTKKTEISCFNQNFNQPGFEDKKKNDPFLISSGKILINRLTGEANIRYAMEFGSFKLVLSCESLETKF